MASNQQCLQMEPDPKEHLENIDPYETNKEQMKQSACLSLHEMSISNSLGEDRNYSFPDKENVSYNSALHSLYRAVEDGSLAALEEIVFNSNCDVNVIFCGSQTYVKRGHVGWSALHLAATHPNPSMTKFLVAQGADVMAVTPGGDTALHVAAKHGAPDTVSFLLDHNVFLRDALNSKGVTPLLKAIFNSQQGFEENYRRCVELLLGAGCNPNISSPTKVTALHIAVGKGDSQLVSSLLFHGANVNAVCKQGSSPLLRAVVARVVIAKIVTELLENGADPSLQVNGRSLLHIAVSRCDDRIIQAFVRNGADPNCRDYMGLTPLSIAVEENNVKVVPILISSGGDINYLRLPQSVSLLSQAVMNNSLAMVRLLLRLGASPSTETLMWSTPLHLAVDQQNLEIIKELLHYNCPLNTTSTAKCSLRPLTPLQLAMELGNIPVSLLLIQAGAILKPIWLSNDRLPLALTIRPDGVQILKNMMLHVPSLLHLTRLQVRQSSGDRFMQLLAYLKSGSVLPSKLISFLTLNDILDPSDINDAC